ncbi:MAG: hypothetical protein ACREDH_00135, partial [Methylocella sp.]
MDPHQKKLALTPEFSRALGIFHSAHTAFDLTTDFAIYKFLGVIPTAREPDSWGDSQTAANVTR